MIPCLILRIAFSSVSIFFWLLFMEERQGLIVSPYSVSMNFNACFFASFFTNGMNVKGTKSWAGALFLVVLMVREEMPLPCQYSELKSKLLGTVTILAWWFLLADLMFCCSVWLVKGRFIDITPITKICEGKCAEFHKLIIIAVTVTHPNLLPWHFLQDTSHHD